MREITPSQAGRLINFLVRSKEKGYTLRCKLQVYFKDGKAKVEIGLARGKKLYDKREGYCQKDARRGTERGVQGKEFILNVDFIRSLLYN